MVSDLHILDFYKDAGRILLALYNQFPVPTTVYVEDISGPDAPDEYGLHSPRHLACLGAMTWLQQSGYIEYENVVRQEAIENASLNHRSFLLLTSYPETVTGQTNAQMLDAAVRSGSSDQLQALMMRLMREMAGGAGAAS
ncbi:hypothetical protein [Biformimicrobium ophioploci]|uniref:Uncharacterized protein n=1 Tax=Biformimicrobium ophioploci TaxID=3036711 RepID=A0ABQ6LY23_9GAMM|nr:hypothetical protein [Microbulbifer sp. NKW57]GMG87009.1 hypothetical protein MNKW57_13300 [Microbulbifer sp. NKW57]